MFYSGVEDYLENNVYTCKWAQSKFEGRKYNILTTNIAKSVNSFMRGPRNFLLLILLITLEKNYKNSFMVEKCI